MSTKLIRVLLVSALAAAGAGALSAAALAHVRAHAELRILSGSARLAPRPGGRSQLTASFTVTNAGNLTAEHVQGWIELTAPRRRVTLGRDSAGRLRPARRLTLMTRGDVPRDLAKLDWTIEACAALGTHASPPPARDGCRRLGTYDLAPAGTGAATPTTPPAASTTPSTGSATPAAASTTPAAATTTTSVASTTVSSPPTTVPAHPATGYQTDVPFFEADGLGQYDGTPNSGDANIYTGGDFTSGYWIDVLASYDQSNQTPETLLVWMHGCGGIGRDDAVQLTSEYSSDRSYIVISLSGPEAGSGSGPSCWDTGDQTDVHKVLLDISQTETEFNINPRRVIIAGYSSGGDLAYQTIFTHADLFAGILAINTDPVRDNTFSDNLTSAIAGAAWKFPIVQVMHQSDTTYPPSTVQPHLTALRTAGFAVTSYDPPGTHYDAAQPTGCDDNPPATCTSGTYFDINRYLLSTVASDGWLAPAS